MILLNKTKHNIHLREQKTCILGVFYFMTKVQYRIYFFIQMDNLDLDIYMFEEISYIFYFMSATKMAIKIATNCLKLSKVNFWIIHWPW